LGLANGCVFANSYFMYAVGLLYSPSRQLTVRAMTNSAMTIFAMVTKATLMFTPDVRYASFRLADELESTKKVMIRSRDLAASSVFLTGFFPSFSSLS
jgi:hypothetical protein